MYRDGHELTYLPDPLANEVAVRILGHPDVDPEAIIPIPLYPDGRAWPDALPFKLEVLDAPGEVPVYDAETRTLRVPLPKAERATVRLSLKLSKSALRGIMGIWRWVKSPTSKLERLALDGRHWMLTPWTDVEVVHAVQRPLLDPTFDALFISHVEGRVEQRPLHRVHDLHVGPRRAASMPAVEGEALPSLEVGDLTQRQIPIIPRSAHFESFSDRRTVARSPSAAARAASAFPRRKRAPRPARRAPRA